MNIRRFITALLLALATAFPAATSPAAARDPVIFVGGGTIEDHVASMLLTTMDGIDYLGSVTANSDCLYSFAMQSQWKVQSYTGKAAVPITLSASRPLNAFPMEYRADSIKVYDSPILKDLPDNPRWPAAYESGEAFLAQRLAKAIETKNPLTLVITNPLTPLAMVLEADPSLERGIKRVVWMGGAIDVAGNLDPHTLPARVANPKAEWNAYWDPQAVDWIFRNTSFPLLVFPLDVTDQAKVTDEFTAALKSQAKRYRYSGLVSSLYGLVEGQPFFEMWNSLTAVYAGRPDIFDDPVPMRLAVATEGYMQGAITRSTDGRRAEVFLNIRDKAAFYEYVLRQLRRD